MIRGNWNFLKNNAIQILDAKLNVIDLVSGPKDVGMGEPRKDGVVRDNTQPPNDSSDLYTQLIENIHDASPGQAGDVEAMESVPIANTNEIQSTSQSLSPAPELARSSLPLKQDSTKVPLLGFRAFANNSQGLNTREGFLAGLFNAGLDISQPDPSSGANRHLVFRHVERGNINLSPFIS